MSPLGLIISICITVVLCYRYAAKIISKRLKASFTAVEDIPLLGKSRIDSQKIRGTAVICGGSVAGLITARICSDHFEQVTIVEPEAWVATEDGVEDLHRDGSKFQKRARVPQYTAMHEYQTFMVLALRRLFSNFDEEVKKAGGDLVPSDLKFALSGIPIMSPRELYPGGTRDALVLTRPAYETTLRRLVRSTCPNVQEVTGSVIGIIAEDPSINRLTSVRVRISEMEENNIPASLVIDCTGPICAGYKWLEDLYTSQSIPSPLKGIKIAYNPKGSTSTYEIIVPDNLWQPLYDLGFPKDFKSGAFLFGCLPDPSKDGRGCGIGRKEYNILHISVGGWDVHNPLGTLRDLKEFMLRMVLDSPLPSWVCMAIDLFEKEQVSYTFHHLRSSPFVYVRYHTVSKQLPHNFIAIGDSVLQLNPVKGQGVTKGLVEAVTLNGLLAKYTPVLSHSGETVPRNFASNFFAAQAKRSGILWDAVKAEDYAFKNTIPVKGESLKTSGRFARAYSSCISRLMFNDPKVSAATWEISNWFAPPTDVFAPWIVGKIILMKCKDLFGL